MCNQNDAKGLGFSIICVSFLEIPVFCENVLESQKYSFFKKNNQETLLEYRKQY